MSDKDDSAEVMQTVGELSLVSKIRSNAAFLRANYADLSKDEAEVVAAKLDQCAIIIEADRQRAAMNDETIQKAVRETAERCILISNQYRNMGSNIPGASKGMFLAAESISAKIAGQFLSAKPEKTKEG